ncbi:hypothetical protein JQX13_28875 [Archangium violaceum]|uniref:hypothetical protein n=1 Tax=Archangium violaceum TaxID=83451 RepID=UPI00193B687F|nr:hypothetical protein [Archangium violaceum]QRK04277.1 hypothetical protein JQX13_28875 [Archangium violaceum]
MTRLGSRWMLAGLLAGGVATQVGCGDTPQAQEALSTEATERGDATGERRASSTCIYSIWGWGLTVLKDQRTNIINYEGDLEIQLRYHANGVASPRLPEAFEDVRYYRVEYPQDYDRPAYITDVVSSVESPVTITLGAELWEIENGLQGATDYGTASGSMTLNCIDEAIDGQVDVSIPGDSNLEKTGLVRVTFGAYR